MYILDPKLLEEIPKDTFYHMTDANQYVNRKKQSSRYVPRKRGLFLGYGRV